MGGQFKRMSVDAIGGGLNPHNLSPGYASGYDDAKTKTNSDSMNETYI